MSIASLITKTSFRLDYVNNDNTMSIRVRVRRPDNVLVFEKTYYTSSGRTLARYITGLEPGVTYKVNLEERISSSFHILITPDIEVTTLADAVTVDTITKTQIDTTVSNNLGQPALFRVLFIRDLDGSIFKSVESSSIPIDGMVSIVATGLFPGETYVIQAQYNTSGIWIDLEDEINVETESIDASEFSLSVSMQSISAAVKWIQVSPDILFRINVFMGDGSLHSSYEDSQIKHESNERSIVVTGLEPGTNYTIGLYMVNDETP